MSIPNELRRFKQWCVSDYNNGNNPRYLKNDSLVDLSIHDSANYMSYDDAVRIAEQYNINFGFVLTKDDPFTCIDIDHVDKEKQQAKGQVIDLTKWTTPEQAERNWAIVNNLHSYTEQSCSLKGFHVWIKGDVGKGIRRDGIEVYSQGRYIACTGKSINGSDILEAQSFLDNMKLQMSPKFENGNWVDEEIELTDCEIQEIASNAENNEKYNLLMNGDYHNELLSTINHSTGEIRYFYPSQSEADLALMSMFTFYSKNNEQCKRMFRYSGLGKRQKAIQDDRYLDETLKTIRNRMLSEAEQRFIDNKKTQDLIASLNKETESNQFLHVVGIGVVPPSKPSPAALYSEIYAPDRSIPCDNSLQWPPGLTGVLARYIYDTAPRPVKEIAIAAALGFLAGICGKGWSITQSGLNLYIVLIARSGVGKEAIHSGIDKVVNGVAMRAPYVHNLIEKATFGSGQALHKHLLKNPCFLNISGEWGRKLRQFSKEDGRNTTAEGLRTMMTELYQKSGPENSVGGMQYSKKEDSVESVKGVAYSFLGETTPDTFYESLSSSMMADGFLSRFTHIEYTGERVPLNPNMLRPMEPSLIAILADIVNAAERCGNGENGVNAVQRTDSVSQKLNDYEKFCDDKINTTVDESKRQMYNRASLKVSKISALLAVADNDKVPVIDDQHVDWAMQLVNKDIAVTEKHLEAGDIGTGDGARQNKLNNIITEYLKKSLNSDSESTRKMRANGIVTRQHLQTRTINSAAFEKYQGGSIRALDTTLKSMVDNGQLVEVDKTTLYKEYKFSGRAYQVVGL